MNAHHSGSNTTLLIYVEYAVEILQIEPANDLLCIAATFSYFKVNIIKILNNILRI